jgi:hypothetical protein
MGDQRPKEFGKRKPHPPSHGAAPQPKRSSHVALLLMGTMAVGGTAYTLMPRQNCTPAPAPGVVAPPTPPAPGMAAPPTQPQTNTTACTSRGSSGSGYGRSSRYSFFSDSSSGHSSSGSSSESSSSSVSRGGFGSLAHAFGFSGS